jgi:O-antigen/teichoic acid export membrane protein
MTFYRQSDEKEQGMIAATITLFALFVFTIAMIVVLWFAKPLASFFGVQDPQLLAFGVVVVFLEIFMAMPMAIMQARIESMRFAVIAILVLVVRVSLAVLLVAVFGWGLWGALTALGITFMFFGAVLTLRELRLGSLKVNWKKFREITRFSLPFIPTGLLFFVFSNAGRFFLIKFHGVAALGLFALGHRIASTVDTVSAAPIRRVWCSEVYSAFKRPDAGDLAAQMTTRILAIYAFVGLGACLFHKELLALLSSDDYTSAGAVIPPLVLSTGLVIFCNLMESVLYVFRRTGLKPWIALIATIVSLALYAWFVPAYGVLGTAYASLGGSVALAVATYFITRRVFIVPYDFKRLSLVLVISLICYLTACQWEIGIGQFIAKSALVALWCSVIWYGNVLREGDKRFILSGIRHAAKTLKIQRKVGNGVEHEELVKN